MLVLGMFCAVCWSKCKVSVSAFLLPFTSIVVWVTVR